MKSVAVDSVDANSLIRLTASQKWLLFWFVFVGIGALAGVGMLWFAPVQLGMAPLLDLMQRNLPLANIFFTGFAWPGAFLLLVVALPQLTGGVLVLRHARVAPWWAVGSGLLLVGWTALQILVVFGPNPLSVAYMIFGLLELATGVLVVRTSA